MCGSVAVWQLGALFMSRRLLLCESQFSCRAASLNLRAAGTLPVIVTGSAMLRSRDAPIRRVAAGLGAGSREREVQGVTADATQPQRFDAQRCEAGARA